MGRYILRRLLISIPVLMGITLLLFLLLNVIPGDPVALMLKEKADPDVIARVRTQMHLDDPWPVRYVRFLGGALKGDLGGLLQAPPARVGSYSQGFFPTLSCLPWPQLWWRGSSGFPREFSRR